MHNLRNLIALKRPIAIARSNMFTIVIHYFNTNLKHSIVKNNGDIHVI